MTSLFPAVIHYTVDFDPKEMKNTQLEVMVDGRKVKSQIPQFTGDSAEMLLWTGQRFLDAMNSQDIGEDDWHDQFERTLHGDPSDLWQEVMVAGDDAGVAFVADEDGFDQAFTKYVQKYVADPNARDTMLNQINTSVFRFPVTSDVAKHIRRIRTVYRYFPKLPGDADFDIR